MAGDEEVMKSVDVNKDKLSRSQLDYMRFIEEKNRQRAALVRQQKIGSRRTGLILGATVFAIYFYSMYAVKQERFIEELDKQVIKERENKQ